MSSGKSAASWRLIQIGQEELARYGWSSYPLYLKRRQRPGWLVTERVMGDLGLRPEAAKGYAAGVIPLDTPKSLFTGTDPLYFAGF